MKPNFETSVQTARDLVERDITLYMKPGTGQIYKQLLLQHRIPEYRKIGENMIISKSWEQYFALTKNEMLSRGTHAQIASHLGPYELALATEVDPDQGVTIVSTEYMTQKGEYKYNHGRGYYRGEMVVLAGVMDGAGYLTKKKWHLNEVYLLLVELTEFK